MLCCLAFFSSINQHQPDSVLIVPFVITTIKSHLALFVKKIVKKIVNFIPSADLFEWESITQKLSSKATSRPVAARCIMGLSIYRSSGDLE